jgi:hypothetical protein
MEKLSVAAVCDTKWSVHENSLSEFGPSPQLQGDSAWMQNSAAVICWAAIALVYVRFL